MMGRMFRMGLVMVMVMVMVFGHQRSYAQTVECIKKAVDVDELTLRNVCLKMNENATDTLIAQSCANSFHSLELCLILNQCYTQQTKNKTLIPYNCWHCWATLEVDDHMKRFQQKFTDSKNTCSEGMARILGFLVMMIAVFFIV